MGVASLLPPTDYRQMTNDDIFIDSVFRFILTFVTLGTQSSILNQSTTCAFIQHLYALPWRVNVILTPRLIPTAPPADAVLRAVN